MPIKTVTVEIPMGRKKLYIIVDEEDSCAMIDCAEFDQLALVKIKLTAEQAARIINRSGHIQDIIPDVAKELREVFISGTTPAEWDATMRGKRRHWRYYQQLGYVFTPEDMGCTAEEMDAHDDQKRFKR
jgi:hypothetical protein